MIKMRREEIRKMDVTDESQWLTPEQFLDKYFPNWRQARHLWPPGKGERE